MLGLISKSAIRNRVPRPNSVGKSDEPSRPRPKKQAANTKGQLKILHLKVTHTHTKNVPLTRDISKTPRQVMPG